MAAARPIRPGGFSCYQAYEVTGGRIGAGHAFVKPGRVGEQWLHAANMTGSHAVPLLFLLPGHSIRPRRARRACPLVPPCACPWTRPKLPADRAERTPATLAPARKCRCGRWSHRPRLVAARGLALPGTPHAPSTASDLTGHARDRLSGPACWPKCRLAGPFTR